MVSIKSRNTFEARNGFESQNSFESRNGFESPNGKSEVFTNGGPYLLTIIQDFSPAYF